MKNLLKQRKWISDWKIFWILVAFLVILVFTHPPVLHKHISEEGYDAPCLLCDDSYRFRGFDGENRIFQQKIGGVWTINSYRIDWKGEVTETFVWLHGENLDYMTENKTLAKQKNPADIDQLISEYYGPYFDTKITTSWKKTDRVWGMKEDKACLMDVYDLTIYNYPHGGNVPEMGYYYKFAVEVETGAFCNLDDVRVDSKYKRGGQYL